MTTAEQTVRTFLGYLEGRDLKAAGALLAPHIEMIFPGGARFTDLAQLVEWAGPRYRQVAKRIERIDTSRAADGEAVFCQGTLYGIWPNGSAFENIRFADWFLVENGLIVRQQVWNDLAECQNQTCTRS